MSNNLKQTASNYLVTVEVPKGSLTAKDIVKKAFDCEGCLTDHEIWQRVRDGLDSGGGIRCNSFSAKAWLTTAGARQFVERFWSAFQSLSETDQTEVTLGILSKLKEHTKSRGDGRPKGAKAQGTERQIVLAAALRFLGCSRAGMVLFLNPTQHNQEAGKQAVEKLLKRNAVSIDHQYKDMNEVLALKILKANITKELAERIVKPAF
jgi:hypothetical protein